MMSRLKASIRQMGMYAGPIILYAGIVWFFLGTLVLGGALRMYDQFWWWDDMLHATSGVILTLVGLLIAYLLNRRRMVPIFFMVLFAFCFALAIGVLWEIYEFCSDLTLHTAMQQWDMPPQAIVMGASYQGMGLRDTMSDLINATVASLATAGVAYGIGRRRPAALVRMLRSILPGHS